MANEIRSHLLNNLKGKQIDIRTTAGAEVRGILKDIDSDFLMITTDDRDVLMPKIGIALITIVDQEKPKTNVQEAA